MATPTVVAPARPLHRAARLGDGHPFAGALALDWANAQAIATLSGSNQQSTAFDTANDRIVFVSVGGASTVVGAWIAVGTNPVASAGAGSQWISQNAPPVPVYVPASNLIGAIQGAAAGTLSMIAALPGTGG